jgi:hypothetical protein
MKLRATLKINPSIIGKVKALLRGAPAHVHQHRLTVGIHEDEAHKEKTGYEGQQESVELAMVAFYNEMGIGVPERSFIRSWFDENIARLKTESTDAMREEYSGNQSAVDDLAHKWAEEVIARLVTGSAGLTPLSPETVRARQKAGLPDGPPLVARGQLVKAIRAMADSKYV